MKRPYASARTSKLTTHQLTMTPWRSVRASFEPALSGFLASPGMPRGPPSDGKQMRCAVEETGAGWARVSVEVPVAELAHLAADGDGDSAALDGSGYLPGEAVFNLFRGALNRDVAPRGVMLAVAGGVRAALRDRDLSVLGR